MPSKTNEAIKKWVLEILGYEYEEGVPLGDYANVLKEFDTLLTEKDQEREVAVKAERERIIYVTKNIKDAFMSPLTERRWLQCIQFTDQPTPADKTDKYTHVPNPNWEKMKEHDPR